MFKTIKYSLLLLTSILFLAACDSNTPSEASETKQDTTLEDKINNKQKYIVIQQYIYDGNHKPNKTQKFIEEKSNFMYSKNYLLIQQNITSDKFGDINDAILTFEYKGE
jgi:lipoprotein